MTRVSLLIFLLLLPALLPAGFVDNEIIVKMRPGKSVSTRLSNNNLRMKRASRIPQVYVAVTTQNPDLVIQRLKQDPDVEYAVRNRWIPVASTIPNDPFFGPQYQLRNTGFTGGVPGADIDAINAWDVTTGSATITLAIVDTGTELGHSDLSSRLWTNPGEIPGNGIDDESNGFIDDVNGWNFYTDSNNMTPSFGHGTSVMGAAGAASNNGVGVAGVDWQARLMTVNGFAPTGFGTEADLVEGTIYAIDNGARVVNCSWGDHDFSQLMVDMALYAQANGALLVAAAGNAGVDSDDYPFYPANLPYDSVICVGASEHRDDAISSSSILRVYNYARGSVDLAAPGFNVFITFPGSSFGSGSGTSYAAPLVTGAAGLVLSVAPSLTAVQLKYRLMGTAERLAKLSERNASNGRLDANAAVRISDTDPPGAVSTLAVNELGHNGAVLRFTSPGGDGLFGKASQYQLRVSTGTITEANFYSLPKTPSYLIPGLVGTIENILLNHLDEGSTYYAALKAADSAGNAGPLSNQVSFTVPVSTDVFSDACNSVNPVWNASGFTLAPGYANTGTMSWQDSPGSNYGINTVATLTGGPFNLSSLARPRFSFYLRHYFPTLNDRGDGLEVAISNNGGSSWKILKTYWGAHAPFQREMLQLDSVAGSSAVLLRFRLFTDSSNTDLSDGVYLDDFRIHEGILLVPPTRDVIVEATDHFGVLVPAPDFVTTGTWTTQVGSKSIAARIEGYSCLKTTAGSPGAQAAFTPFIPRAGQWEVLTTWSSADSATGVRFEVKATTGTSTVLMDQISGTGNRWVSLGTYGFNYGQSPELGSVLLDASASASGNVRADTVRFRYAGLDSVPGVSRAADWVLFD